MSDNAIRGDTKSSTGEYFRQLIFYKILLMDDYHFNNKRISPYLVFVSPDDKGRCPIKSLPIEKEDIKIRYVDIPKEAKEKDPLSDFENNQ